MSLGEAVNIFPDLAQDVHTHTHRNTCAHTPIPEAVCILFIKLSRVLLDEVLSPSRLTLHKSCAERVITCMDRNYKIFQEKI